MIRVVAILTAKPGRRADLLAHIRRNLPKVLAEQGCIEYQPVVDADGFGGDQTEAGPDVVMVIETWADAAALKAHSAAPHMTAFRQAAKDVMAGAAVYKLSPV
jgi:quinol monooxygenase YgiN